MGPVAAALGAGAVLGPGSGDREPADQRAVGDGAREARVPFGVPAAAVPGPGERLVRVEPHARGEGAVLDQLGARTPVQPCGAVGGLGRGREPDGELHGADVPAGEALAPLHARQPVVVAPEDYGAWLAAETPAARVQVPHAGPFALRQVGTMVNITRNDGPEVLRPVDG